MKSSSSLFKKPLTLILTTAGPVDVIGNDEATNGQYTNTDCGVLYRDNVVLILWMVATFCVFLGLVSTIYTVFLAYQLYALADEYEKSIIDVIDEGLQILLPTGICKQICHPTIGATNFQLKNQATLLKKRQKENRYPDDVTYPPSDIELFYDFFGDEDVRVPRTISLMAEKSADETDPPPTKSTSADRISKEKDKEKSAEPKPAKNPFRSLFSHRKPSYEKVKEPEQHSTPATPSTPGSVPGKTPSKDPASDETTPLLTHTPKLLNKGNEVRAEEKTPLTGVPPAKHSLKKSKEVVKEEDAQPDKQNAKPNPTTNKLSKEPSEAHTNKLNPLVKAKSTPSSSIPKTFSKSKETIEEPMTPVLNEKKSQTPITPTGVKTLSKEQTNEQKTYENFEP